MTPEQIAALPGLVAEATPGPWRVEQDTTLIWGRCDPDDVSNRGMGYPIAESRITPISSWAKGPDLHEGEANARLIALAPDLAATVIEQQRIIENLRSLEQQNREAANREFHRAERLSEDASKAAELAAENERLRAALMKYRDDLCEGFCGEDDWSDEGHCHPYFQGNCVGCLAACALNGGKP